MKLIKGIIKWFQRWQYERRKNWMSPLIDSWLESAELWMSHFIESGDAEEWREAQAYLLEVETYLAYATAEQAAKQRALFDKLAAYLVI